MDRKWLYRAAIAALLVVFILLIAKTTIIGMRPDTAKIDRAVAGPEKKAAGEKGAGDKTPGER